MSRDVNISREWIRAISVKTLLRTLVDFCSHLTTDIDNLDSCSNQQSTTPTNSLRYVRDFPDPSRFLSETS